MTRDAPPTSRFHRMLQKLIPSATVRRGMKIGGFVSAIIVAMLAGLALEPGFGPRVDWFAGPLIAAGLIAVIGFATVAAIRLIGLIPRVIPWLVIGVMGGAAFAASQIPLPDYAALYSALWVAFEAAFVGAIAAARAPSFKQGSRGRRIVTWAALVLGIAVNGILAGWLIWPGTKAKLVAARPQALEMPSLDMPDPREAGPFGVSSMTYGSGDDWRAAYGENATLTTDTVDATPFTKYDAAWKGWLREWYWGFSLKNVPLNGRVWYPEGDGPFPLVLMLHGNHRMEHPSEEGYAYLGEHLASRGYIFVSVDENYLNTSWHGNLVRENDCRAWILLKHLELWREWNGGDSPFAGKADMANIALMGHSRGGEAATIAAAFNRLDHYPDNAEQTFNFDFSIKSVVSIAPSDGQYRPSGKAVTLTNTNFLLLASGHDADVSEFAGARQYARVKFDDDRYWFKASVYAYRANHGQFNTIWGRNDLPFPLSLKLNKRPIMAPGDQRQIAKACIAAFLDSTLRGEQGYLPWFRDFRRGTNWLPEDIYVTRFRDTGYRALCDFEEDIDVTTGSAEGVRIRTDNIDLWRESALPFRGDGSKKNTAAYVGWRLKNDGDIAAYTIHVPGQLPRDWSLSGNTELVFSMAETEEVPEAGEEDAMDAVAQQAEDGAPNIVVCCIDAQGREVRIDLAKHRTLPPVLHTQFTKFWSEPDGYGSSWEATLQDFAIPFAVFTQAGAEFDPEDLSAIRFEVTGPSVRTIVIDDIGVRQSQADPVPGQKLAPPPPAMGG